MTNPLATTALVTFKNWYTVSNDTRRSWYSAVRSSKCTSGEHHYRLQAGFFDHSTGGEFVESVAIADLDAMKTTLEKFGADLKITLFNAAGRIID